MISNGTIGVGPVGEIAGEVVSVTKEGAIVRSYTKEVVVGERVEKYRDTPASFDKSRTVKVTRTIEGVGTSFVIGLGVVADEEHLIFRAKKCDAAYSYGSGEGTQKTLRKYSTVGVDQG